MTDRLYFKDSHLLDFEATVLESVEFEGRPALVLDRTAFYPTGGGQPNDVGSIDEASVVDVLEPEDDRILHLVDGVAPERGARVTCRVDPSRRLDHLQQHTGQHILSQAFVQLFGAETRGFRMGADASEIDVALATPSDEAISAAEDLANRIVFSDRAVRVHVVDQEAARSLPLRRESLREGDLRVIEIEGFDWSPCGGTHAHRTGEVGLIAVRGFERAKGLVRVEFVAGGRALADYRKANATAMATARQFSTGRDDGPDAVRRLGDENKRLRKRIRELAELASDVEGRRLFEEGEAHESARLVARRLDGRSAEELRLLVRAVLASGPAVALLGSDDGGAARLTFARSEGLSVDCGSLMRAACELLGGRGGGKGDLAQGGGPNAAEIDSALAGARQTALVSLMQS